MLRSSLAVAVALGSLLGAANLVIADDAKPASQPAHSVAPDKSCLHRTGSRIPVKASDCTGGGSNYSKQEIDSTGATTAGGALHLLSPTGR